MQSSAWEGGRRNIFVDYRADVDQVAGYLPAPLEPVEVIRGYSYNPCWTTAHTAELLETCE